MEKKFLSIKEAADMLNVSRLTLRNWDKAGKLTAHRHPINNYRVYRVEDIQKIIDQIKPAVRPVRLPDKKKKLRVMPLMG